MNKKTNQIIQTQDKKLLPLTSDIVFKRVFAREGNQEILKEKTRSKNKTRTMDVANCRKGGEVKSGRRGK